MEVGFLLAWFSATQGATLSSTSSKSVSVSAHNLADINLKVEFTITADDDVELTNDLGETYYISNGVAVPKNNANNVGEWSITEVDWVVETGDGAVQTQEYLNNVLPTLEAATYTVTLKAAGQVHFNNGTTWNATDADNPTFVLTLNAGGTLSLPNPTPSGHFNVRALADTTTGTDLTDGESGRHTSDSINVDSIVKING